MITDDIADLALQYQRLISNEHHKDRDCHFRIVAQWSYGGPAHYVIEHDGYLFGDEELPWLRDRYITFDQAAAELVVMLKRMIREQTAANERERNFHNP